MWCLFMLLLYSHLIIQQNIKFCWIHPNDVSALTKQILKVSSYYVISLKKLFPYFFSFYLVFFSFLFVILAQYMEIRYTHLVLSSHFTTVYYTPYSYILIMATVFLCFYKYIVEIPEIPKRMKIFRILQPKHAASENGTESNKIVYMRGSGRIEMNFSERESEKIYESSG